MKRIIYAPRARRDIAGVLQYTQEKWGPSKAREYRDLIREALEVIAEEPERGKVRAATRPGILSRLRVSTPFSWHAELTR